jgi:hypothetical protein
MMTMAVSRADDFATLAWEAMINRDRIVNTQTLAMGLLGMKDAKGEPVMNERELNNPLEFLLLNNLATLVRLNLLPLEASGMLKRSAPGTTPGKAKVEGGSEEEEGP